MPTYVPTRTDRGPVEDMVCEHQMQEQTLKSEQQEKKAETMGNQWRQSITED